MPHVKLDGTPALEEIFPRLPLLDSKDETGIRKICAYYMDRDKKMILAEALVAAGGLPQRFFLSLKGEAGHVVVRLLPATDPEKNAGVKRLVAQLGLVLRDLYPEARLGSTNLDREIEELARG